MIFSEIYSVYYNTVARILKAAVDHPVNGKEIHKIIEDHALGESRLSIAPALETERWQLIRTDGTTPLVNVPTLPLTLLQKRWLKALTLDPRIRLFAGEFPELADVDPLFTPEDYVIFDRYLDGDPYEDEAYIANFRLILDAIKKRYLLDIGILNRKGRTNRLVLIPEYLEYSEKDDKFRLIGSGTHQGFTVNLGRILSCRPYHKPFDITHGPTYGTEHRTLELELWDRRNALERVMLHFAHFEKEAEKLEDGRYRIRIVYDKDDETELVIRVLSFGPMIKVTSPQSFADLIKDRLIQQKSCGQ